MKTQKQKLQDKICKGGKVPETNVMITHPFIWLHDLKPILKALKDDLKETMNFDDDELILLTHNIIDQKFTKHIGDGLLNSSQDVKIGTAKTGLPANTEPEDAMKSSGSPKSKDVCDCCGLIGCEKDNQHKPKTSKGEVVLNKEDLEWCSPELEHYMDTGELIDKPCKCHKGFGRKPKTSKGGCGKKKEYLQFFYIDGAYDGRNVEIIRRGDKFLILKYPKSYGSPYENYVFSARFIVLESEGKNRYKRIKEFEYDRKTRKDVLKEVNDYFDKSCQGGGS